MKLIARFIHHCVAHPVMFWTCDAPWAVRLHDWTAAKAWPEDAS